MVHFLIVALIFLAIVGLILWGVSQIPGIPPIFKTIMYVIVGVLLLIWLLRVVDSGQLSVP